MAAARVRRAAATNDQMTGFALTANSLRTSGSGPLAPVPAEGAIHLACASGASLGAAGAGQSHAKAATTTSKVQQTLLQHVETHFQQPSIVGISLKLRGDHPMIRS